jgi:hypothetical protein
MDEAAAHDRLRHLLILGMVGGLTLRVTLFHAGGIGSWASISVFWVCAAASVFFGAHQVADRIQRGPEVPVLKWALLAVGVAAFLGRFLIGGSIGTPIFGTTTLVCVVWALILGFRDLVSKPRRPGAEQPG